MKFQREVLPHAMGPSSSETLVDMSVGIVATFRSLRKAEKVAIERVSD